jgi:predicted helicase
MLAGENLSFATTRQTREPFSAIATDQVCGQHKIATPYDGSSIFPLYLYTTPENTAGTLFAQSDTTRTPNLSPAFIAAFSEKLDLQFLQNGQGDLQNTFGPEDVFYYTYAIFHSPTYRTRYADFLKMDFPRLPLTSDNNLFTQLVGKGKELVQLHLLKSPKVDSFVTSFPEPGDNQVEQVIYADGKVHINNNQYFGDLPSEVWSFKVGGYQVCDKWLKDRRGRQLNNEEIDHYQRVIVSLQLTIKLMEKIDKIIPRWPMQ